MALRAFLLVGLFALTNCAASSGTDADGQGGASGKADGWNQALADDAKAYAERFDFEQRELAVDRELAGSTGPAWVQRAYALHYAWEQNDLGSSRLYKWSVGRYRVWAIRTSTDGDDSFIELFDADGRWLATGIGGYAPDDNGGFEATIHWDAQLGEMRSELAPEWVSDEAPRFYDLVKRAAQPESESGTTVSVEELRFASEVLLGGEAWSQSFDGWDRANVRRILADPSRLLTNGARAYGEALIALYERSAAPLSMIETVAADDVLTLSADKLARFKAVRASKSEEDRISQWMIAEMLTALDRLPNAAVPVTRSASAAVLRRLGLSSQEAEHVIDSIGNSDDTQWVVTSAFTFGNGFEPQPEPEVVLAAADAQQVIVLKVQIAETTVADLQASAVAELTFATGQAQPAEVGQVRFREHNTFVDLHFEPRAGQFLNLAVALPARARGEADVVVQGFSPAVDAQSRAQAGYPLSPENPRAVELLAVTQSERSSDSLLVVYRTADEREPKMASLRLGSGPDEVAFLAPDELSEKERTALTLSAARHHAEELAKQHGSLPLAETLLRTMWRTVADVQDSLALGTSPVGFDAATEHSQYMLEAVWGDLAVFVTFANDGSVRIEDFN